MTNIMTNIPTELLRTLVAVVDLRSFTKAAQSLGVTQPAVSAQIKRLQVLLGGELLDKSAPGVMLTEKGHAILDYGRRLLALNDRILELAAPRTETRPLAIGIPGDFGGALLPSALAQFHRRSPNLRFTIRSAGSDHLLHGLRQGEIDLAVALTQSSPTGAARHRWAENLVWIRGPSATFDPAGPVPLATYDESCMLNRLATQTLDQAGFPWEVVFSAPSGISVTAAVAAGLGISPGVSRFVPDNLIVWNDEFLPPLPTIDCGIYLRDGHDHRLLELLADAVADAIRPSSPAAAPEWRTGDGSSQVELRAGRG